jgi:hypothetical protein
VTRAPLALLVLAPLSLAACSNECNLFDPTSCDPGLVCEPIQGTKTPHCFPPVELVGKATDSVTGNGLNQALVTALDQTGAPATQLTVTASDGVFTLRIPSFRQTDGTPVPQKLTLFASSQDHRSYPSGLQRQVVIDTAQAKQVSGGRPWTFSPAAANIELIRLPPGQIGQPLITGAVQVSSGELGVVVTAELAGRAVSSTLADGLGGFTLFNVPPGVYSVKAYAQGVNYDAIGVNTGNGSVGGVGLTQSTANTTTVNGTLHLPPDAGPTDVILVLESTFDAANPLGVMVPGLRAPAPGTAANVTGSFSIPGVPDGRFVAIPASATDGLTPALLPDGGVQVQHLVVSNGAADVVDETVIAATQIVSPGGSGAIDTAPQAPTFVWTANPAAASYQVQLFDALGNPLAFSPSATDQTQLTYSGTPLAVGGLYQWRLLALDASGSAISQSEQFKGLFIVQ